MEMMSTSTASQFYLMQNMLLLSINDLYLVGSWMPSKKDRKKLLPDDTAI